MHYVGLGICEPGNNTGIVGTVGKPAAILGYFLICNP